VLLLSCSNGRSIFEETLGKTPNIIASICNNKSQTHLKDLKKIAQVLDVDIRDMLIPTKKG
jgi:hypothetical protein